MIVSTTLHITRFVLSQRAHNLICISKIEYHTIGLYTYMRCTRSPINCANGTQTSIFDSDYIHLTYVYIVYRSDRLMVFVCLLSSSTCANTWLCTLVIPFACHFVHTISNILIYNGHHDVEFFSLVFRRIYHSIIEQCFFLPHSIINILRVNSYLTVRCLHLAWHSCFCLVRRGGDAGRPILSYLIVDENQFIYSPS